MTLPPAVTVVVPTYNRLWSLPDAVASCRRQGCPVEIIVIDDGSTDATWEWLRRQTDVVALRQENLGKDWAVNRGYAAARGRYVKFLDSDDAIPDGVVARQLALAESTGAHVVVAGYEVADGQGVALTARDFVETDDFIAQQLGETDGSHYSAFLFRRDFLADVPHRQEFGTRDDRMFILEVALRAPRLAVLPGAGIRLRQHSGARLQAARGLRESAINYAHLEIYRRVLGALDRAGELTERRRKAACKKLWPLAHWIARTHLDDACEVADWIARLDPAFRPPEPGALGRMYATLGFRRTERLLRVRRALLARTRRTVPAEAPLLELPGSGTPSVRGGSAAGQGTDALDASAPAAL